MNGPQRLRLLKDWSQVATLLGLLAGGIWAVWTFVFQNSILPSRLPAHLSVDNKLEVLGRTAGKPGLVALKATIQVENGSSLRVCVLGSTFNMRAFRVNPAAHSPNPQDVKLIEDGNGDFVELPQTVSLAGGDVINSGRLFPASGTWLEAGQDQTFEFVTFVPAGYGLVRLRSDLRVSKSVESDTERCYSDKLVVGWNVAARDGLVTMDLSFVENGKRVPYDYRSHKDRLNSYVPYHVIAFSHAAMNLEPKAGD